jgi:hypothetical protein
MKYSMIVIAILALCFSRVSYAEVNSSNVSISYLAGENYRNAISDKTGSGQVVSIEHTAFYSWGKSYSFIDRELYTDDVNGDATYGEIHADYSLTGNEGFSDSVVRDVYAAFQWEHAARINLDNLLLGATVAWNVPGFIFLDTSIYYRDNGQDSFSNEKDDNLQLSTAWLVPFSIAGAPLQFAGFIDASTETKDSAGNDIAYQIKAQPQLKLDLGHFWNQDNKFFIGIEYNYWKNKLGVDGQDQSTPQLLLTVNL